MDVYTSDKSNKNYTTKAVVVLGETLHVDDAVDDYNDALGNSERRMLNFVDTHAEPLRSLYVGEVPATVSRTDVHKYFEKFGALENITMPIGAGQKQIFAQLVFEQPQTVDKIQKKRPHYVSGHKLPTKRALLQKDKKLGYISTNMIHIGPPQTFSFPRETGGLADGTTKIKLYEFFSTFGEVVDINMGGVRVKSGVKIEKNSAMITFADPDVADQLALLRGLTVMERSLEVTKGYNPDDDSFQVNSQEIILEDVNREARKNRKVVVNNLPEGCTEKDVRLLFEKLGDIEECNIRTSTDENDLGRLLAVFVYTKADFVDRLLETRPHQLSVGGDTRRLDFIVRGRNVGVEQMDTRKTNSRVENNQGSKSTKAKVSPVVVLDLPETLSYDQLKRHFLQFGSVDKLLIDASEMKAYIHFAEQCMADYCLKKQDHTVDNEQIKLEQPETKSSDMSAEETTPMPPDDNSGGSVPPIASCSTAQSAWTKRFAAKKAQVEKIKDAAEQARKTRIEGSRNLQVKPLVKIKPHVKPVKPNKGDPDEVWQEWKAQRLKIQEQTRKDKLLEKAEIASKMGISHKEAYKIMKRQRKQRSKEEMRLVEQYKQANGLDYQTAKTQLANLIEGGVNVTSLCTPKSSYQPKSSSQSGWDSQFIDFDAC